MTTDGFEWPVTLRHGPLEVRPMRRSDRRVWDGLMKRNEAWLAPWSPTDMETGEMVRVPYLDMLRHTRNAIKARTRMAWMMTWHGQVAGQINVNNIVWGVLRSASVGYWVGEEFAGRGITTRAVALVLDHCMTRTALHRVEVCIRPENRASLRVAEKLRLREEGLRRDYLYIDGGWRDHRCFAVTRGEYRDPFIDRLPTAR